jgi:hypothetical protein
MLLSEQTSLLIGVLWALVCVGVGTGPELVGIVRGLRARFDRRRTSAHESRPQQEERTEQP